MEEEEEEEEEGAGSALGAFGCLGTTEGAEEELELKEFALCLPRWFTLMFPSVW
jgi:hypothetical protein